jgi:hypothetical protein
MTCEPRFRGCLARSLFRVDCQEAANTQAITVANYASLNNQIPGGREWVASPNIDLVVPVWRFRIKHSIDGNRKRRNPESCIAIILELWSLSPAKVLRPPHLHLTAWIVAMSILRAQSLSRSMGPPPGVRTNACNVAYPFHSDLSYCPS